MTNQQAWSVLFGLLLIGSCSTHPPQLESAAPDFNGIWGYNHLGPALNENGGLDVFFPARDGSIGNFEKDFAVLERADENMPIYRPEHWATIRELDHNGVADDPVFNCRPSGLPRMGPPQQIVQNAEKMVFLYTGNASAYRVIPLDGRDLSEAQKFDYAWYGYSSGRFVDNKLVITTRGFNDQSWLGWSGWIHSADMVVTETIWRTGDTLHWFARVDDSMLQEPWTTSTQSKVLNTAQDAFLWETPPCEELDREHMVEDTRG